MADTINWYEIPAEDLDRAAAFYGKLYNTTLQIMQLGPLKMAFIPMEGEGVGGAVVQGDNRAPSKIGTMVYLSGGNDLSDILSRVEGAGGTIEVPKVQINEEIGYMAIFHDSEGNRIGLHSPN